MDHQDHPTQQALRHLLAAVIAERGESLAQFGATLAGAVNPDRRPYTKAYVIRLRDGHDRITDDLARGLRILAVIAAVLIIGIAAIWLAMRYRSQHDLQLQPPSEIQVGLHVIGMISTPAGPLPVYQLPGEPRWQALQRGRVQADLLGGGARYTPLLSQSER